MNLTSSSTYRNQHEVVAAIDLETLENLPTYQFFAAEFICFQGKTMIQVTAIGGKYVHFIDGGGSGRRLERKSLENTMFNVYINKVDMHEEAQQDLINDLGL
jgi:hypothetical protein